MFRLKGRTGLAATVIVAALVLLAAPAAWADTTPTLTDAANNPAQVGDQIALQPGTYDNDPAPSLDIVDTWYDCDTAAPTTPFGHCTPVQAPAPAPAGDTYTVAPSDQTRYPTSYIVVFESDAPLTPGTQVSNSIQVQPPTITPPPPPPPPAPTNVSSPSILGTPTVGSTLIAVTGAWQDFTSTAYAWSRCDSGGASCAQVATGGTYLLTQADVGAKIRLTQTATNTNGNGSSSTNANSALFGPIATPAGKVTPPSAGGKLPAVSGTPQVGTSVRAKPVTMSNNPSYSYQWLRCATNCTAISGATTTTYSPSAADLGRSLEFAETGKNAGGSVTVRSAQSTTVTAPTATTLQLTPNTIVAGQPVTLIATVTSATAAAPPKGKITFANSGTPVKSCNSAPTQPSGASATVTCRTRFASTPSSLSAVFTPAAGSLVTGSDSTSSGFVVGHAPTTLTLKVPTHLTLGHRTTLVAKVHPAPGTKGIAPTGTVLFVDGGKPIKRCAETLSAMTARCSITYHKLGSHAIVADYLGDSTFSGASSKIHKRKVTVAKPSGYVTALMAWTFRFSPASTKVATLRLTGLVPGVSVALACSGDGCPLRHHVYRMTKRSCAKSRNCKPLNLAKRVHHARLDVGAKLTVRLTHRSWVGKYYRFVIRAGRKPKIVTSCLAVGVTRPGIACTPR